MNVKEFGPKMVALGYFWGGRKADISVVRSHEDDNTPLPKCDAADECDWKAGEKPLTTVGDFVRSALIPSMDQP
jgi:hypothetical protein